MSAERNPYVVAYYDGQRFEGSFQFDEREVAESAARSLMDEGATVTIYGRSGDALRRWYLRAHP